MPRYFFDLGDGETQRDEVGVELETLADARAQAVIVLAGAMMPEASAAILRNGWRIDVRGEAGAPLFSLEYRPADGS